MQKVVFGNKEMVELSQDIFYETAVKLMVLSYFSFAVIKTQRQFIKEKV